MADKKSLWEEAGKAGLVLGLISIAYMVYGLFAQDFKSSNPAGAFGISALNLVVWGAKFAACIILFKKFVQKYVENNTGITNSDSFRFGVAMSLLSALLYSGAYLAYYSLINPEGMQAVWDATIAAYASQLDSNSLSALDEIHDNIVNITFFVNLIWCFLFGLVLSAIFSRRYPSQNPFDAS